MARSSSVLPEEVSQSLRDLSRRIAELESLILRLVERDGPGPQTYTPATAAQRLDLPEPRIREMLRSGRIKGFKEGSSWLIPARELDAYIKRELIR